MLKHFSNLIKRWKSNEVFFCKGEMGNGFTNHIVNYTECIIIIKNVPCEKCEQCGEVVYSDEVVTRLEKIVNQVKSIVSVVAIFEYDKMVS